MHELLEHIDNLFFKVHGLKLTSAEAEPESREYAAHTLHLNGHAVKFRMANITPTKTGQFVTLWKRNAEGITAPFDITDTYNVYLIATRIEQQLGLFIFPKTILHEKAILSDHTKDGKRGIRVYPTWDEPGNKQAMKSQEWQTKYFVDLSKGLEYDQFRINQLLNPLR